MEVELLPYTASDEVELMERVAELTNDVYAVAETGLWVEGAIRTTLDEAMALTRQGEIAVARVDGRVVGAARVQKLDEHTGEVGMLSADQACRGIGIGRELLRFAEQMCRKNGMTRMQLELLVPREWSHSDQGVPGGLVLAGRLSDRPYGHDRRGISGAGAAARDPV